MARRRWRAISVGGAAVSGLDNSSSGFVQIRSGAFSIGTPSGGGGGVQFMSGKMDRHRGSSDNPIIGNSSDALLRYPDGQSGCGPSPQAGPDPSSKMDQCVRRHRRAAILLHAGGKRRPLQCERSTASCIFYCRASRQRLRATADRRSAGNSAVEVGLQFAWKLPTSSTWSSWLDASLQRGPDGDDQRDQQDDLRHQRLCGDLDAQGGHRVRLMLSTDSAALPLVLQDQILRLQ